MHHSPVSALLACLLLVACATTASSRDDIDAIATCYVELALGADALDPDLMAAYQGPEALSQRAKLAHRSFAQIGAAADTLRVRLDRLPVPADALDRQRRASLRARLVSLGMQMQAKQGRKWPVAEEVALRYGFQPSFPPLAQYAPALERLDRAMPGSGPLPQRVDALRSTSTVPVERLAAVFAAALAECRQRAAAHLPFPPGEHVEVQWTDEPLFSGNDEFYGNGRSVARISRRIPQQVDQLLILACHEIYPGHHLHFATQSAELLHRRGWVEYAIEQNVGPFVPTAEAVAEYGVGLAFPPDERLRFERDVLYPLAGLTLREPAAWRAYFVARSELLGSTASIARDYLDGRLGAAEATALLARYRLLSADGARRIVPVMDTLGSYLIVSDLGWQAIDQAMRGRSTEQRWALFARIEREPILLGDIAAMR